MRVAIIGGTGFLGYFTSAELIRRGHEVVAIGIKPPAAGSMPDGARISILNADTCTDGELTEVLSGCSVLMHAAGADGRDSFPAPAIEGFRKANVEPMRRLVRLCGEAGIGHFMIFGSYYTALDRQLPHLNIVAGNAYPKSRKEQADLVFSLAGNAMDVTVLELPYIFGGAPGRGTLWGFYIDSVRDHDPDTPVPAGGSACVTAAQVARAAAGACERSRGHRHYNIAGENLSYSQIFGHFADALGVRRRFVPKSFEAALTAARKQREALAAKGIETGYDPVAVAEWQNQFLYVDPLPAMEALGFGPDDIGAAISDTVKATLEHGGKGPASLSSSKTP